MPGEASALALGCFALSWLLTRAMRKLALSRGILDVPNERSSHRQPTPRGGGVAIVATATMCFALLVVGRRLDTQLSAALAGSLLVAAVGFFDDRESLRPAVRLAAHGVAAAWAMVWLGGLPQLRIGAHFISLGWAGYLLGGLGIVWAVNLFNFMDGVDGIAASEAIFIALAGALLNPLLEAHAGVASAALVLASACGGFLAWNWPPAKIFLGDVGSGYLGYVIVVLALGATRDNPVALWVWLILGGAFFVDATVTLLRRILRREQVHAAHRTHAYQWLARRWNSHGEVTLAVLGVNLLWLFPCAVFAGLRPALAAATVIFALAPVAVLAIIAGAGRLENNLPER
jgi:Fuc2NAc and GlcNAc transferase